MEVNSPRNVPAEVTDYPSVEAFRDSRNSLFQPNNDLVTFISFSLFVLMYCNPDIFNNTQQHIDNLTQTLFIEICNLSHFYSFFNSLSGQVKLVLSKFMNIMDSQSVLRIANVTRLIIQTYAHSK